MPELYYRPFNPTEYLSDAAICIMLPEQEGAYNRLLAHAWGRGAVEPSLPADDDSLAKLSRLGSRWRKLGPLLRQQFSEREGRLYHCRLSALWTAQQEAYTKRANAGHLGGEARAKRKRTSSNATAMLKQSELESELEGERSEPLQGSASRSPASVDALGAVEAPRAPAAEAPEPPTLTINPPVASPSAAKERAYFARLRDMVARFKSAHPDRYEEVVAKIRLGLALPRGRPVPAWYQQQFDDAVLVGVRELHPDWPPSAEDWKPESEEMSA